MPQLEKFLNKLGYSTCKKYKIMDDESKKVFDRYEKIKVDNLVRKESSNFYFNHFA